MNMYDSFNQFVNEIMLSESFTRVYNFERPASFDESEVFYKFKIQTGEDIYVQLTNEYTEDVLTPDGHIMVAFGQKLKNYESSAGFGGSWIKVDTEELLNVKDSMTILTTAVAVLDDFLNTFFSSNSEDTSIVVSFYGGATPKEEEQDVKLLNTKRARIYQKIIKPVAAKYNLELYTYKDGRIELTNS